MVQGMSVACRARSRRDMASSPRRCPLPTNLAHVRRARDSNSRTSVRRLTRPFPNRCHSFRSVRCLSAKSERSKLGSNNHARIRTAYDLEPLQYRGRPTGELFGCRTSPPLSSRSVIRDFTGSEIGVVEVPDLGTLVSVTVLLTIDSGSTTFTVLLPRVNLPAPPAL